MSSILNRCGRGVVLTLAGLSVLAVTGCSRNIDDLRTYVEEVKSRPGGRIEPLPQVKPYESFVYEAGERRSPFVPARRVSQAQRDDNGLRPDAARNREFLESFPLDSLRMVGSLALEGSTYALLQAGDGLIHRVRPGNYIGQNDGKITAITESEIKVLEIVPDGLGGYLERPAAIALSE